MTNDRKGAGPICEFWRDEAFRTAARIVDQYFREDGTACREDILRLVVGRFETLPDALAAEPKSHDCGMRD